MTNTPGKAVAVVRFGNSFTHGLVIKEIRRLGLEVLDLTPDPGLISAEAGQAGAFLLFLGSYVFAAPEVMGCLQRFVSAGKCRAVLAGTQTEITEAEKYFDRGAIAARFTLPFAFRQVAAAVQDVLTAGSRMVTRTVLLVDDDPAFLHMLRNFLSAQYEVVMVGSGTQALQYLADHHPDLVLLDYDMPAMDGPTVLQTIRSEESMKKLPVFFLTGEDSRDRVARALKLSPQGYILKSTPRKRLLQILEGYFAGGGADPKTADHNARSPA